LGERPDNKLPTVPGKIVFKKWLATESGHAKGILGLLSDWVSKEGVALLTENCESNWCDVSATSRRRNWLANHLLR
jgi:hypothetical protein